MKKRILSILLVAALAAGTLFGCGSVKEETNETTKTIEEGAADAKTASNADSITNTEPVEITIAYPSDDGAEEKLNILIEEFNYQIENNGCWWNWTGCCPPGRRGYPVLCGGWNGTSF